MLKSAIPLVLIAFTYVSFKAWPNLAEGPMGCDYGLYINSDGKRDKLESLLDTYAAYGEFSGAILVEQGSELAFKKAYGFSNIEWEIPNTVSTKFRIGSITKQFTAMLIMILAEEGSIQLHAPISTYLADYPIANADRITIHHLLTHTSGTPNSYDSPKPKVDKPDMVIPDNYRPIDLVLNYSSLPLDFAPGERFSYSNSGYVTLGYIIETVTGQKLEEALQEKILKPLDMNDTGIEKHRHLTMNRAAGYFKSWGQSYNANYVDMSSVYSAGAMYSTVEDLNRWHRALLTDKLVSFESLELISTPYAVDSDYHGHYGYGWSMTDKQIGDSQERVPILFHDGVIDGFCAFSIRMPGDSSSIILLSNFRRAPLNAMIRGILGILNDQPYSYPDKSAANELLDNINEKGIDLASEIFDSRIDREGYYVSENELNVVSYKLLQADRAPLAARVLEMAIEVYPEAFNLYDSYGEILRELGRLDESIKNYEKSLELNPKNENAKQMLKEIQP